MSGPLAVLLVLFSSAPRGGSLEQGPDVGPEVQAECDDANLLQVSLRTSQRERSKAVPTVTANMMQAWQQALTLPSGPTAYDVPAFHGKLPIELMHTPKCAGSSFLNVLMHLPGACANLTSDPMRVGKIMRDMKVPVEWQCNLLVVDLTWPRMQHSGLEFYPPGGFNANAGRYMTIMRQPEQRLLSHYYYDKHYWGYNKTLEQYLPLRTGCYVRMLTGDLNWSTCDDSDVPLSRAEVDEAIRRLRTGFSFVGILEEWNLSICLFNKIFSQPCRNFQFRNTRPTFGHNATEYNVSVLNGYKDPIDNELYNAGLEIFRENLNSYSVSAATCEPCWRSAGVL
uniref:Sulfotransferase domain-containing protein n=1 Tax=Alexandrium andersonii TaxID=327968 RepID=A0A7S2JEE5_9DINO